MSNEIAVIETPGQMMPPPAPPAEVFDTGLSGFVKLKPSRLALIQHTTVNPQGANPGQILDEESGEVFDSIPLVVINMHPARVYFKPGAAIGKGAEPLCRSWDGIVPANDVKVRQSSKCATCAQAQWGKDKTPSPCKLKLEMVVGDEAGIPHYLSVGGKGLSSVRTKLGEVQKGVALGKFPSPLHVLTTFRGVKDKTIYKLEISKIETLTDEQAAPHIATYRDIKAQKYDQNVIDAEVVADDAVDGIVQGEIIEPTVPQQV